MQDKKEEKQAQVGRGEEEKGAEGTQKKQGRRRSWCEEKGELCKNKNKKWIWLLPGPVLGPLFSHPQEAGPLQRGRWLMNLS